MYRSMNHAAVLGAGVMGSGIAALLAAAGTHVLLLDIVPKELSDKEQASGLTPASPAFRNRFAEAGKKSIQNPRSGMLFAKPQLNLIEVGNMTDDMEKLAQCDWIIEVVVERLDVKQSVMAQIAAHRKPGSIVSSNTSGVSIAAICEKESEEFRQHFLGTHFFNPPRYMKLFEMIPTKETLPAISQQLEVFAQEELGKGVVYAKDTPNFIGNRIGTFAFIDCMKQTEKYGYSIPTVDALTGPVLGRPNSATYKTADMVGLDILYHVAQNVQDNVASPDEQVRYTLPGFVSQLIDAGAFGDKVKHGFYQKTVVNGKKTRLAFDPATGTYAPIAPDTLPAVNAALNSLNKYESIVYGDAKENHFAWDTMKNVLLYSAAKIPEISDDFRMVDKALVWGFNWEKGPFQIWDEIGLERSVKRMQDEGESVPGWVLDKLRNGETRFYGNEKVSSPYLQLDHEKQAVVAQNDVGSLLDLGDDVLCMELHSKGNAIGEETMEMLQRGLDELDTGAWRGMVIGNMGKNFSAGADLSVILKLATEGRWDTLDTLVAKLQRTTTALKYASRPVVAAPFAMTLGGGAEIAMHAAAATPYGETYLGLVEAGVGLIPAGGGTKELLVRSVARCCEQSKLNMLPAVKAAWKAIATAQTSTSGFDAIEKCFLSKGTHVVMNKDALITSAKQKVLEMAAWNYHIPAAPTVKVLGDTGRGAILYDLQSMTAGNFVSDHDALIAKKAAFVLTGGNLPAGTAVSEAYLLDLEREAFLSLAGEEKTQQRIAHMLKTGKPLRN
ncbi:MAG: 3-hydroxyacyl-CoA dehydrogenase NAD-binding domain-containing protein [Oscillibacter sp.]